MNHMYPKKGRVILHIDMNSFYASVEMAYNPDLKGRPLAIAGNVEERKGIIVTCSYEARKFGVKTTMPVWQAKKLCPGLIIQQPNFDRYRQASLAIFELFRQYTERVEPVSIDEGYLDITDCGDIGTPIEIAQTIQRRIMETMDLPCSIGIAPNKFLAKMASDMKKPLGITILRKRDVPQVLWPMKAEEMHGIGLKTAEKLASIGIQTIGDLAVADDFQLRKVLGINGTRLKERANGKDERPVDPDSVFDYKSVGNSTTLPHEIGTGKVSVSLVLPLLMLLKKKLLSNSSIFFLFTKKRRRNRFIWRCRSCKPSMEKILSKRGCLFITVQTAQIRASVKTLWI